MIKKNLRELEDSGIIGKFRPHRWIENPIMIAPILINDKEIYLGQTDGVFIKDDIITTPGAKQYIGIDSRGSIFLINEETYVTRYEQISEQSKKEK